MCPVVKEFTKLDIELKIICEISGLCNEINQDYKNRDKKVFSYRSRTYSRHYFWF